MKKKNLLCDCVQWAYEYYNVPYSRQLIIFLDVVCQLSFSSTECEDFLINKSMLKIIRSFKNFDKFYSNLLPSWSVSFNVYFFKHLVTRAFLEIQISICCGFMSSFYTNWYTSSLMKVFSSHSQPVSSRSTKVSNDEIGFSEILPRYKRYRDEYRSM